MSSIQFQIHTDKENAASVNVRGAKVRSFQTHKTPRRALGSVNEANRVDGRTQMSHDLKNGFSVLSSAMKQKNTVAQKDSKLKGKQPDKENVIRSKQQQGKGNTLEVKQQQTSVSYCLPDIEYMPPSSPPRDEDEEILPLKKRTSTYVHKLLSWRPPCFFGTLPDNEEEEEEEKEHRRMMDELDNLPVPNDHDISPPANLCLRCEELDIDSIHLPSMEDVPLPYIDDTVLDYGAVAEQTKLDDSVGLVPHLGSLEILDHSWPSVPQ